MYGVFCTFGTYLHCNLSMDFYQKMNDKKNYRNLDIWVFIFSNLLFREQIDSIEFYMEF